MKHSEEMKYFCLGSLIFGGTFFSCVLAHQEDNGRDMLEKALKAKIVGVDQDYSYIDIDGTPKAEIKAARPKTMITKEDFQEMPGKDLAAKYRQIYVYDPK